MDDLRRYFICENCQNREFKRIYTFSLRFHSSNFSDELIYDRVDEETYLCTKCNKSFSVDQIEEKLSELKNRQKSRD